MNTLKFAAAVLLALVVTGCASLGPSDQTENVNTPFDSTQYGGF
jgi:hypothetical protein